MSRLQSRAFAGAAVVLCSSFGLVAQVNVLTYHNDNARTGANLNETILTPANVNSKTFGKLFAYTVDGNVYAQPLYVSGLEIPGQGVHNVVFVATEHNSVYAFDADSNSGASGGLLWHVNLGPSAQTPSSQLPFQALVPEVGITGTPVIDPGSGTLYVDTFIQDDQGFHHQIHALDITTGAERPFSPTTISVSIPANGVDSTNGVVTFNAIQQIQRAALTLSGGILYVAYAGYADTPQTDPYHGWVLGFDAATLQLLPGYVFNSTPNATTTDFGQHAGGGGIWMGGDGPAVDYDGSLFFSTGNGSFNAFSGGTEYGDSVIKLSTGGGMAVADYFTPYNQQYMFQNDLDLASGGVMLLPDQPGPYPHLMVAAGKTAFVYLINRDQMTTDNSHYNPTGTVNSVLQMITLNGGSFSTPAYFNGRIYWAPVKDALNAYSIDGGVLSAAPVSRSPRIFGFPGATPSVSANGSDSGIVWAIQRASPAVLAAYDASDLSSELYSSDQATGNRDQLPVGVKFAVPTIANGKVYVGGQNALTVFGLLSDGSGSGSSFPAASYSGIFFVPGDIEVPTSGSVTLRTSTSGIYSGQLLSGGNRYSFRDKFDSSGSSSMVIKGKGGGSLQLQLQLDIADFNHVNGTVSDGTWIANLTANRAVFDARSNPYPLAGKYTMILPGASNGSPETPQGDGYGSVMVDSSGQVRFTGALPDGTRLSQSAILSQDGEWPFYVSLSRGVGILIGWLNLKSATDLNGQLAWIKSPSSATYYPDGFQLEIAAMGSAYQPPPVSFTDATLTLTGGNLASPAGFDLTLNSGKGGRRNGGTPSVRFSTSTGLFSGTASPGGGKPVRFSGAILQDQNLGSGYFLGTDQSGRVSLTPR